MAENKNEQQAESAVEKLNENLTSASEKIANNQKVIYIVVACVAVVAALIMSYVFLYRNPRANRAFEAYNQVEISAAGNDSVAAAEYKKVADKHSGTNAGKLAYLSAAESYYELGKYKEALECLDNFSTSEAVLASNALILKGDCYVNLKKYNEAIDCYRKAVDKAGRNEQIVPRVLLKEANIYDEQKKYDKARECYESISKEYPKFQLGSGVTVDAYIEREKARLGK